MYVIVGMLDGFNAIADGTRVKVVTQTSQMPIPDVFVSNRCFIVTTAGNNDRDKIASCESGKMLFCCAEFAGFPTNDLTNGRLAIMARAEIIDAWVPTSLGCVSFHIW